MMADPRWKGNMSMTLLRAAVVSGEVQCVQPLADYNNIETHPDAVD